VSAFELSDEQLAFVEHVRALARENLVPLALVGAPGRVNRPLLRELAACGLLKRLFPQRFGGSAARDAGIGAMDLCLMREALACECTEAETALALQGLGAYPILLGARAEIAQRFLPRIACGEAVAAIAVTEKDAGSDAAAIALRAERDGSSFRLTGEKLWISNAPEADVIVVFARTTQGARGKGVTAFVVEGGAQGLSGESLEMLAPHAIGRLVFDAVRVGEDAVLGRLDEGFKLAMRTLDLFRPSVGAFAVGMAQAALEASLRHAGERRQFGVALREHQAIAHRLADMAVEVEAARLLVYRAASAHDSGRGSTRLAAMAKLFATEMAQRVVDAAVQIHGAQALERGHLLEHLYREVRAPRIYEGTSEIQRNIIARDLYR
jgi:alkylation response protein AidB-like acyl-CoA dehydrogenase